MAPEHGAALDDIVRDEAGNVSAELRPVLGRSRNRVVGVGALDFALRERRVQRQRVGLHYEHRLGAVLAVVLPPCVPQLATPRVGTRNDGEQ